MFAQTLHGLILGFQVALLPHNLLWVLVGVVVGNLVGVLPGMGALSAMAILLPLTFAMNAVAAILMLSGIFYGAIYGGAIGAILLNLPCHPPHAVTCIDGYPLARQGRGGAALSVSMIGAIFAAAVGIVAMILFSPLLIRFAFKFQAADVFSIMLFGLLAGATTSHGSPLKGLAMTLFGMLCGSVGTDINTGVMRYTFDIPDLANGVGLVALTMGLFAIGDFFRNAGRMAEVPAASMFRYKDVRPTLSDLRKSFGAILRGTSIGGALGAMPGTSPTIASFMAYALEKKISKTPQAFGHGAIEGVAAPESAAHAKTQFDFIPTLCLGIPGDPVMALILGALMIQGVAPGPQLITDRPDVFWGLIASFWIGNVLLVVLNIPLIGFWVRLLKIPYRYLVPIALFFIAVGAYSTQNDLFQVGEVLVFGLVGAIFAALEFPLPPILLGFVLGPLIETNFQRAVLLSFGHLSVFFERPISATFMAASVVVIVWNLYGSLRALGKRLGAREAAVPDSPREGEPVARRP